MNFNDNFDLKKAKSLLLSESKLDERFADKIADMNPLTREPENVVYETEELDEMAKIAGDLKTAIEDVINSNPELEGLALKKAIKADASVQKALAGDDLYDNQLNKFIALSKGERTLQQRGRKSGTPNATKNITSPENDVEVEDPNQLKLDFDSKPETIKIKTSSSAPKSMAPAASTAPAKERDLAQEIKDVEAELKTAGSKAIKSGDAKDMAKAKALTAKLKSLRAEVK